MYKHLFLEADSGEGKSTLIRKIIAPYIGKTGGFSSQRLLDEKGNTVAFRLTSSDDLRMAVPYEDTPDSIFRMISSDAKWTNNLEVFETEGCRLLNDSAEKKLILLDEIGGIELKNEAFSRKLHEILKGDIPCIGVIKQHRKASSLSCSDPNHNLRESMLTEYSCKIIKFQRNNPEIESEVRSFIEKIFVQS